MLVARLLMDYFGNLIKWFTTAQGPRWKMKGGHPVTWMILSVTMLHTQFVGVYCGAYFKHAVPIHLQIELPDVTELWFASPDREPPDINQEDVKASPDDDPIVYEVNQNNVIYSFARKNTMTQKRGSLVDRGANGGLAGSDTRALTTIDHFVDVQGIDNH